MPRWYIDAKLGIFVPTLGCACGEGRAVTLGGGSVRT